ncbi:hypothetical protein BLX24_13440 [Arsenicibacter rosenii]|uniref:Peptidase S1 domain-containing protein n=1 Tax=Arsenicibacter rosenii TaxID=1750698 RepID=A0A1S2VIN8_9BACT|nr:hypothetical protein BLX24_13440 [Arsenicibacter rosenii]
MITTALLVIPASLNAQVLTRRSASGISFDKSGIGGNQGSPMLVLPAIAVDQLMAEDEAATKMGVPFRFGTKRDADVTITTEGQRSESGGNRLYSYQIYSEGAYSLNLLFDRFHLIDGASLYIYNPGQTMVIGPITSAQNPANNQYWTDIIAGSQLIIELREPLSAAESSDLHLSGVVHGYRNLFPDKSMDKVFGSSASCELNMTCYPNLQNEGDGVVMILLDQATRLCTGSMVNTTRQSFRSFMLTAFHCIDIGTYVNGVRTGYNDGTLNSAEIGQAQNWLIRFNYQSPTCNPSQEDNEVVTLNGSALRAAYNQSDFALMEIYQQIPTDVNTTYLGWNKANANTSNAFSIHHPQGDVKKISFASADTQISGYGNTTGNDHLTVPWGSLGVTEGGSSGSPLFDANKRIIGQLHGGPSYCGAPSSLLADYYGRLYTSWAGGGAVESRLADWLDPLGSGAQTTNSVKAAVSGPSAFTGTGTFALNVNDNSIVSWSVSPANSISVSAGTGNTASLVATGVASSLTITFTVNVGQPYPIRFTKVFAASVPAPTAPAGGISSQTLTVGFPFAKTIPSFTDTYPLTYSMAGLPAGLTYNATTRVISGTPAIVGTSSVTVTATNTANLSTSVVFTLSVIPQGPLVLLEPSYNCLTRQFVFQYTGGNTEPVQFMSVGVTNWTTATTFTLDAGLVNDPNLAPLVIFARQGNTSLSRTFDIRTYCKDKTPNSGPVAPTLTNQSATLGQFFTYLFPEFTDSQPVTYQALGLPNGISLNTRLISGVPSATGVSSVTIVATDADGLSTRALFNLTVFAYTPPSLSVIAPTYNCQTGAIKFNTAGGDGTTIEYMAIGVTGWTTNPNQVVEAGVRNDPNSNTILIRARQSNIVTNAEFNIRQYCIANGQNQLPVAPAVPNLTALVGQAFSYTVPAFIDDQSLYYLVVGMPYGLSFNFQTRIISGTPMYTANYNVSITAYDPYGLSANISFVISVVSSAPSVFTLIDPLYNCSTRQLTFRTTGGTGTTIKYMAVGVTGWTTNPVQTIEAAVVADPNNNYVILNAQQDGNIVSRTFNFRQACGSAREAVIEPSTGLTIRVLENPTTQPAVSARIAGSAGLPLTVELLDLQGQTLTELLVNNPSDDEPVTLRLTKPAGLYLLRARNQQQVKTVKIIKGQ